ncbi:MAG TPA: nucleotidyltransferase family protein [Terriglobia bacterium]|nr:nucleotidyltransferase family protein [Terriglobia bacterium]
MIAGLILAAGESSRMGTDKALLLYRGRTFLEHILATLHNAGIEQLTVVLGHHADEIQLAAKLTGTEVVVNQDYRRGQTSSLQAGLRALDRPAIQAVVLCLVDHPAVSTEVIRKLVAAFEQSAAPVVIPTYQGQRGHPALISRALFAELMALSLSEGANTVVRKYCDSTHFVEVDDPGVLIDVDDPESFRRLNG